VEQRQREKERWIGQKEAAKKREWEAYRDKMFRRLGMVPSIIAEESKTDRLIFSYLAPHWHSLLFEQVIHGRIGRMFTFAQAVAPFVKKRESARRVVFDAVRKYLYRLRSEGYIYFIVENYPYISDALVFADLAHPPPEALVKTIQEWRANGTDGFRFVQAFDGVNVVATTTGEIIHVIPAADYTPIIASFERADDDFGQRADFRFGWG
jgi:hypothetical protein